MPMTPSCHPGSHTVNAKRLIKRSPASAFSSASLTARRTSASSRIFSSSARRLRLCASRVSACFSASALLSANRQAIPWRMSSIRPAALRRGPMKKPMSSALILRASRPAVRNSAYTPGRLRPARIRLSPCSTRIRLTRSSGTRSATVPMATKSMSSARGAVP